MLIPSHDEKCFLNLISCAICEGTSCVEGSDDGYNVLCGSTIYRPLLFHGYADHPRIYNRALNSTAAGRYQHLARIFDFYKLSLNLPDFSPASQDAIALRQIQERHARDDINAGRIAIAIVKCSNIWASFPGNKYGQPHTKIETMLKKYRDIGGYISS